MVLNALVLSHHFGEFRCYPQLPFSFLSPYLYSAHQGGIAFQHCCHYPVMASKTSTTELARQSLLLGEGEGGGRWVVGGGGGGRRKM